MFRALTLVATMAIICSFAQAQAQKADDGAQARARLFGTGSDVRYQPRMAAYLFGQDSFEPMGDATAGLIEGGRFRRPAMAITAPIENGPCRLLMYQTLPTNQSGGLLSFLCRPDQALPYVFVSYEQSATFDPATIAMQLASGDQASLGLDPPICSEEPALAGVERVTFCESTFDFGGQIGAGRAISVVGSNNAFFFRASTACAGAQCHAARPAFHDFVAQLNFD